METTLKNVLSDAFWIMPATPKYKNQGIPYITSKNIKNRRISFNDVKYIDKADYDVISKNRPILENDILISMIGTLGEVAVVQKEDGCFYGQNMYLIRLDESKISQKYFLNWVESDAVKRAILQQQNKSTQSYLKAEHIEGLLINVPNMIEQDRIAVSLEKINAVIEKRKQQLQKLDEFVKARFVEMFGDLKSGTCHCSVLKLKDLSYKISDGVHAKPNYTDNGKPFLSVVNINKRKVDFTDCKYVSEEDYAKMIKSTHPQKGDVLYTKVGATYGIPAYIDTEEDFCLYVSVCLIKPIHEKINSRFLAIQMDMPFVKHQADSRIKGIGVPDLHLNQIREFDIICPERKLQNQFVDFVEQIDKSKLSVQKSLDKLELLKKALMQKYFG